MVQEGTGAAASGMFGCGGEGAAVGRKWVRRGELRVCLG